MKKLFYIFIALALVFTACKNNEPEKENGNGNGNKGQLDPNAMILIRGVEAQLRNQIHGLTPLQVVEQAMEITFHTHYFGNVFHEEAVTPRRGFGDHQRDFDTPALKMAGTDIITQGGIFWRDFIYGFDVYVTGSNRDTIAYIPNSILENARVLIREAFDDENYTEVYRLFNEAFTFFPLSE